MTTLKLKRAYEPASDSDGYRVYIDRLWPRGLSHETFRYDSWDKDIAPSTDLRHWFHENPDANWSLFAGKYAAELHANPKWPDFVAELGAHAVATLLYSSHNEQENNARVVLETLLADFPDSFTS